MLTVFFYLLALIVVGSLIEAVLPRLRRRR